MESHRKDKAARAGAAPVFLKVPADLTTPVRAFLALTRPGEDAFLLESVAGGEAQARYSFLGFKPAEIFLTGRVARTVADGRATALEGAPAKAFQSWISAFETRAPKTPAPFMGGAVGWMDFSAFALSEPVLEASFPAARDPRIVFGLFSAGLVFDHLRQEAWLYKIPASGEGEGDCLRELEHRRRELDGPIEPHAGNGAFTLERSPDRVRFSRNLASVQAAILAGDAYQIVISEPFEGRFDGNPFEVYRRLRRLNPSPYHFYVSLGGRQVVGASPEMLIRVEDDRATTVPIAGTRRRGATPDEDRALEESLVRDPKELAEHAMLVDLARNDLGRVCAFGSVEVPVRASVERFSHVMHLTSEVQGRLAPGRTALDALLGTFPAGTVSGAPKIRAVQILSELEGEDRGVYGGAVGTVDTEGNLETCIAIRTLEFEAGRVRFRAGAGIVADSQESSEWEEIHHKAGVMLQALRGRP